MKGRRVLTMLLAAALMLVALAGCATTRDLDALAQRRPIHHHLDHLR